MTDLGKNIDIKNYQIKATPLTINKQNQLLLKVVEYLINL